VSLISFEPCDYDCRGALEVARATLNVVGELDAAAAEVMEERLRCTIAVSRAGDIVRLEVAAHTQTRTPRLMEATPVCTKVGLPASASAVKAAKALQRRPRRAAKPRPWDWWSPVVVDFDH